MQNPGIDNQNHTLRHRQPKFFSSFDLVLVVICVPDKVWIPQDKLKQIIIDIVKLDLQLRLIVK